MSTTTMRAARLHGNRKVTVEDRSIPSPESGQVLLKVAAAGICGSDLGNYRSPTPEQAALDYVPGHEPCGDIVELGPDVGRLEPWRPRCRISPMRMQEVPLLSHRVPQPLYESRHGRSPGLRFQSGRCGRRVYGGRCRRPVAPAR